MDVGLLEEKPLSEYTCMHTYTTQPNDAMMIYFNITLAGAWHHVFGVVKITIALYMATILD